MSYWFKSLLGAASAQFPYNIGDAVPNCNEKSIWTLHKGTKKDDNTSVSIFAFDPKKHPGKLDVAKNGFKRAKTIRHPNVLTFLDGLEMDTQIYIVTEEVFPLDIAYLEDEFKDHVDALSWGLYQITKAVSFIDNECNLVHGNVVMPSVFVTKGGDWKLGSLDLVCDIKDPACLFKNHQELVNNTYKPPEVVKGSWQQIQTSPPYTVDTWMLGCLIYEIFNGRLVKQDDLKNFGKIPKHLQKDYQQIFNASAPSRLNPNKILESPYFKNSYVDTCLFLENFALKDTFERDAFFKRLEKSMDDFPVAFCKYKILPHLITALDYGAANPKILGPVLKIGGLLTTEEYNKKVTPSVVKWFSSPDRNLRINLLENLQSFSNHLSGPLINDQIFPSVVNGFTDLSPVLRELTVRAMLHLVPKMSEKVISTQMLKHFAKLQMDPEPGIRTNTTICLGKIAVYLSEETRKRVLVPAFSRALRDPFLHARVAGLMAFSATQEFYDKEDCATKIVPVVSVMMIDPEKQVRQTAGQCMKLFIKKVETLTENMGSTSVEGAENAPTSPTDAANGLMGWAYKSLSKKIYGGSITDNPDAVQSPSLGTSSAPASAASIPRPQATPPPSRPSNDGWDDEEDSLPAPISKPAAAARPAQSTSSSQSAHKPMSLTKNTSGDMARPQKTPARNSFNEEVPPKAKFSYDQGGDGWDEDPEVPKPTASSGGGWDDDGDVLAEPKPSKQTAPKASSGWDDDDTPVVAPKTTSKAAGGWDDDAGWEDFGMAPKAVTPQDTGGERKLTRMELAQKKKEEAQRKRGNKAAED